VTCFFSPLKPLTGLTGDSLISNHAKSDFSPQLRGGPDAVLCRAFTVPRLAGDYSGIIPIIALPNKLKLL